MKTSTKNTIIKGCFSIAVVIIGGFVGSSVQTIKTDNHIEQQNLLSINEVSINSVDDLLNGYIQIQSSNKNLEVEYTNLEDKYNQLLSKYKNEI